MRILIVDDDQAGRVEMAFRETRLYVPLGGGRSIPLADVVSFDRACEALRWLDLGCPIDTDTGDPITSAEDVLRRPHIERRVPEVAVIDIDFNFAPELDAFPRVEPTQDKSGRLSARLGWPVASKLQQLSDLRSSPCEITMYTGKEDVVSGLREACRPVDWAGGTIPPFVRVEEKIVSLDKIMGLVEAGLRKAAIRHLENHGVDPELVERFRQRALPYRENQLEAIGREQLIAEFGELFRLAPVEARKFLLFADSISEEAARAILALVSRVNYHRELLCSFKTLWRGRNALYLTPLAAACHAYAWDYDDSDFGVMLDSRGRNVGLATADRAMQEAGLTAWLRGGSHLPQRIKDQIIDAGPLLWAKSYGNGALTGEWENSFHKYILGHLVPSLDAELAAKVHVAPQLSTRKLLTDWGFFLGGLESTFGRFIQWSAEEGASRIEIRTIEHPDDSVELVLAIARGDGAHVGSERGLKGRRVDELLRYWGEAWYVFSLTPPIGSTQTTQIRYSIWPGPGDWEPLPPVNADQPVFELHWKVPDYLSKRQAAT